MSGGRGRGRGSGLSFNAELLGIGRGQGADAVPAGIQGRNTRKSWRLWEEPPPAYPIRPGGAMAAPLLEGSEQDYLLAVRKQFYSQMRCSPLHLKPKAAKGGEEGAAQQRFADKFEDADEKPLDLDWPRLPACLRPRKAGAKKKRPAFKTPNAPLPKMGRTSSSDVSKKLDALEKAEKTGAGSREADAESDAEEDEDEEDKDKEAEAAESEGDEDMDEGTDYAKDYFDNGEGYLDDDDEKLDDDGVY